MAQEEQTNSQRSHVAREQERQHRTFNTDEVENIKLSPAVRKQFQNLHQLVKGQDDKFDGFLAEMVGYLGEKNRPHDLDGSLGGLLLIGYEAAAFDTKKGGHQARDIVSNIWGQLIGNSPTPDPQRVVVSLREKALER